MQSKFMKGLLFAWIPLLFFIVPGFITAVRTISSQKATGLGAVAGGLMEYLTTFGLVAIVACEIYGVKLLAETFSKEQFLRGFVSVISIGCGVLFVLALGAMLYWLVRSGAPH